MTRGIVAVVYYLIAILGVILFEDELSGWSATSQRVLILAIVAAKEVSTYLVLLLATQVHFWNARRMWVRTVAMTRREQDADETLDFRALKGVAKHLRKKEEFLTPGQIEVMRRVRLALDSSPDKVLAGDIVLEA